LSESPASYRVGDPHPSTEKLPEKPAKKPRPFRLTATKARTELSAKEFVEQCALMDWCRIPTVLRQYPEIALLHHIPNGEKRDAATAARLKRMGVKPGIPDLFLPAARAKFHGLYVELKRVGKDETDVQEKVIETLRAQGYAVAVCQGWEMARKAIERYLTLVK
jgi:hypothetical protein